jgi:hypothetical protein
MDPFEKGLLGVIVIVALAIFVMALPDLRRYLKLRSM